MEQISFGYISIFISRDESGDNGEFMEGPPTGMSVISETCT